MRCAFALNAEEIIGAFTDEEHVYILCEYTKSAEPIIINRIEEIENLGHSSNGDKNQEKTYLIVKRESKYKGRIIRRNDGSIVWAWDNINIDAPIVCFGGEINNKVLIGELSIQNHMSYESKKFYNRIV